MRALFCERPGVVVLRDDIPIPTPSIGEVVVRVAAALTCGTDLKLIRRGHPKVPFPVVLGHELAGVVARVGEGAAFSIGDRVTATTTGPCGLCVECEAGRENLCPTAFDRPLWGAFADYVRVPARVVLRGLRLVPPALSDTAAALLDPLASVVRGVSRAGIQAGSTVLVYGAGPIGLLWTVLARAAGARVLAAGRRTGRLAALAAQGAEPIDLTANSVRAAVREATRGRGADVVVDLTGDARLASDLLELVGRGGTLMLFAGAPRDACVELHAGRIHYDEVSVVGSFHYTPADAWTAFDHLVRGTIPVEALVTGSDPLEAFEEVFARLARGDGMKTAFLP